MKLRPAIEADVPVMAYTLEHANAYRDGYPPATLQSRYEMWGDYILERMAKPDAWTHVAELGQSVVGFALGYNSLHVESEKVRDARPELEYLSLLMVHPSAWGRGVASSLLGAVSDTVRDAGREQVFLWTGRQNSRARAVYERNGYRAVHDFTRSSSYGEMVYYLHSV